MRAPDTETISRLPVEQRGPRGFVCPDYFIAHPRTGERLYRNDAAMPGPASEWVASLYDWATDGSDRSPERCATCAFRRGTQANACVLAVSDALEALSSGGEFGCHHGGSPFETEPCGPCRGFEAVRDSRVGEYLRHLRATGQTREVEG